MPHKSGACLGPQMEDFKVGRQEAAIFSVKSQLVFSALWAINTIAVMTTQLCCCRVEAATDKNLKGRNVYGCVSIKLYIQKQAAGWIWLPVVPNSSLTCIPEG